MPPILSRMPIVFKNGRRWGSFSGECNCCRKEIPDEMLRGLVTRPIESVAVLEAVGICETCKVVTRYDFRFHDDARITGERNGKWRTWHPQKTLWQKLFSVFRVLGIR